MLFCNVKPYSKLSVITTRSQSLLLFGDFLTHQPYMDVISGEAPGPGWMGDSHLWYAQKHTEPQLETRVLFPGSPTLGRSTRQHGRTRPTGDQDT